MAATFGHEMLLAVWVALAPGSARGRLPRRATSPNGMETHPRAEPGARGVMTGREG
jgi:hypothetical protein